MKAFSAALLAAAVCLLAANGAVEASRVGPARQLQQFNNGLGESCLGKIEAESFILSTINILLVDGLVLIPRYRLLSYVRRGMCLMLSLVEFTCCRVSGLRSLIMPTGFSVYNGVQYLESFLVMASSSEHRAPMIPSPQTVHVKYNANYLE